MDLYLKAATEADMNAALIAAVLAYEGTEQVAIGFNYDGTFYESYSDIPHTEVVDEEGNVDTEYPEGIETVYEEQAVILPAPGVSLDVIGPISKVIGYDEDGEPIIQEYPEWHVNVRVSSLTEEQQEIIAPIEIVPPEVPFRVWA